MALPILEKTWQYNVNQQTATSGVLVTDCNAMLFKIKQSLTGFASTPWTVVMSSDSASAGAADYWITAANIIHANPGVVHSWIVLQQTGITGGPLQICLDLGSSDPSYMRIVMSYAGFTGGTTTDRPTATDEQIIWNPLLWFSVAGDTVLNVMQSTSGDSTRLVWLRASGVRGIWIIDNLSDSLLTYKGVYSFYTGAAVPTLSTYYNGPVFYGRFGALPITAYTGTESYNATTAAEANSGNASNITNAYPITPLSLHSETISAKGRLGRLADLWFGSTSIATGSTYPMSPADKEFVHFIPFVMPWNGTTPILV